MRKNSKGIYIDLPADLKERDSCRDYLLSHVIKSICVTTDDGVYCSDFLNDVLFANAVEELQIYGNLYTLDPIYRFTEIKSLTISSKNISLDFSKFHNLRHISIGKCERALFKNAEISAIESLSLLDTVFCAELITSLGNLKVLSGHEVRQFDFEALKGKTDLECLSLIQCDINDLKGIKYLIGLKSLSLMYCKSLKSVDSISEAYDIEKIDICSCNNLKNIDEFGLLPKLKVLFLENQKKCRLDFLAHMQSKKTLQCLLLENCGSIPSITFLDEYEALEAFGCFNTSIDDGNISPLLRLRSAKITNKRHYNLNDNQLHFNEPFIHWWLK